MIDPLIGRKVLGRYRILRSLAVGGMGVIYLGRSEGAAGFAKPVVIKRVVSDFQATDSQALEFFVREATILAELRHPGIVSVVDFGDDDGAYTMVLEYVHGFHVGQWLKYYQRAGSDFPADLAIHIVCQLLDALDHAHHVVRPDGSVIQIVHRDITPSNVLVDIDGHVKLADFGIARISTVGEDHTQSGVVRGKMPYLAPELLHGKAASAASDVYSAAVMLHELLLGRNDFRSEIPAETVRLVLHGFASSVEPVRPDAPRGIDAVLERALAKDRGERFASAAEFRSALLALELPSADVLARKLAIQVKQDFAAMPAALGLERLEDRDSAWRSASSIPPPSSFLRTAPHEDTAGDEPATHAIDVPTRAYGRMRPSIPDGESDADEMPTVTAPPASPGTNLPPQDRASQKRASSETRKPRTALVAVAALSLLAIGIGIGAIVYSRQQRVSETPRFIVIESNSEGGEPTVPSPISAASTPSSEAPVSASSARSGVPVTQSVTARTASTGGGDRTLDGVTQTFASRRGAIRSCFERHDSGSDENPTIEIRFRIDADGVVEQARLSPSSLEATELGACVVAVARGTRFGPIGRAMSFSIPVTASRVTR